MLIQVQKVTKRRGGKMWLEKWINSVSGYKWDYRGNYNVDHQTLNILFSVVNHTTIHFGEIFWLISKPILLVFALQ